MTTPLRNMNEIRASMTRELRVVALRCEVQQLAAVMGELKRGASLERKERRNQHRQQKRATTGSKVSDNNDNDHDESTQDASSSSSGAAAPSAAQQTSAKSVMLTRPGIRPVLDVGATAAAVEGQKVQRKKVILLDEAMDPELVHAIPGAASADEPEVVHLREFLRMRGVEVLPEWPLQIGYENCTSDEVLRSVLPENVPVPSAYEVAGHIMHLNLRDEQLPFKELIGQVLLDKSGGQTIRTVVNKVGSIHETYRTFDMELIAGEADYMCEVSESNCKFRFDYRNVYWNSRLQMEHTRLWKSFGEGELVADMMAGIGPFAVPAAKHKSCRVWANDLNPESYRFLEENARRNRVQNLLRSYNMDGREFIKKVVREEEILPHHVVMNLPASAVQFLDSFRGLYAGLHPDTRMPQIHCYGFTSDREDPAGDMLKQCSKYLEFALTPAIALASEVRDVAPNKRMYIVSFTLPTEVAFAEDDGESATKRQRID